MTGLGSAAAGPTQLALTAVATTSGAIPKPLGLALVAGVVVMELSSPLRRLCARYLSTDLET